MFYDLMSYNLFESWIHTTATPNYRLLTFEAEWRIYASVNQTIIGSDNGLSPDRRKAIIWTNAGILLIVPLETTFSEILIEVRTVSFKKIH